MLAAKHPLQLAHYCASEVITGPPLGACSLRDPRLEMHCRRLRWLCVLANQDSLVGTVHRTLATLGGTSWVEPSASLTTSMNVFGWSVHINYASPRVASWPRLLPEPSYGGDVLLEPQRGSPPDDAVWTDGSVGTSGGAAAVQFQFQAQALVHVSLPRSSTQCELVALGLTSGFASPPSVILTDSLCSLQLIRSWGKHSTASVLLSLDRAEVRAFLYKWQGCPHPPKLEKVKDHDEAGRLAGKLKTLGNDLADSLAQKAAEGAAQLFSPSECFSDAVQLRDPNNHWVVELTVIETQWCPAAI